jgi:hypothetical protein
MTHTDLLYAPPGTKVRFLDEHGLDYNRIQARKLGLVEGGEYTLSYMIISDYHTNIFLEEFPGKSFNSVMFSCKYEHPYSLWINTTTIKG